MPQTRKGKLASERLSREDWINEVGRELAQGGVVSVSVMTIAQRMGVTKGSFYWHFEDRDALLNAFLADWREKETLNIIENIEKEGGTVRRRLEQVADIALREVDPLTLTSRQELAVRDWALREDLARKAVASVDRLRLHYLIRLFSGMGLSRERASLHAHLFYANLLGQMFLPKPEPFKQRGEPRRRMIDHLLDAAEAEANSK